jgi:hypothetical protein
MHLNAILFLPLFLNGPGPLSVFCFSSLFSSFQPSPTWPFSSPSSPPKRPSWPSFFSFSSPAQAQPSSSFFLPPLRGLLLRPSPPARPASSPLPLLSLTAGPHLSEPSSSPSQTQTRVRVRPAPGAVPRCVDLEPARQDPRGRPINPSPCALGFSPSRSHRLAQNPSRTSFFRSHYLRASVTVALAAPPLFCHRKLP